MFKAVTVRATLFAVTTLTSLCAYAVADTPRQLDIPAGDLSAALLQLSSATGADLVYRPEQLRGLRTGGAHGSLTAEQAVTQLLQGTKLQVTIGETGAMLIATPGSNTGPRSSTQSLAPQGANDGPPGAIGAGRTDRRDDPATAPRAAYSANGDTERSSKKGLRLAQANAGSQTSETAASGSAVGIDEVVVTAQKRAERLQDVPISISVLNGAELEKSSVVSVNEALNRIPGVAVSEGAEGGGTQIAIRGVTAGGPLYDGASPIGYYLDSVPFALVRSGIGPDANIYDLQRIEVLRGPQGTLYGASAENGVVRVLTNDADLKSFDVKVRASDSGTDGGGNNYRGDAAVNVPLVDGKLAVRAVLGYENDSGWIDAPVGNKINDDALRTYRVKVNAQPTDELSIAFSVWSERDVFGAPSTADVQKHAAYTVPEPLNTDYDTYGLKIGYDFAAFTLTSMTSYLDYTNAFKLDLGAFGAPGLALSSDVTSHMYSEELLLNSKPGSSVWRWSAGGFYRSASDRSGQDIPVLLFTDESRSYALFGELTRSFLDARLELTLGLRYFHDDVSTAKDLPDPPPYNVSSDFNATTPRAVLTWHPDRDLTLYASFSEGFRSGSPQYYTIELADPALPPLKPDKLYNYELGSKADLLGGRLSVDAAIYYIDWRDVQQALLVPYDAGGRTVEINALTNGNSASGPGVDFSVTAHPVDALDLGASLSWNDLSFDSDVFSGGTILFSKGERLNFSSKYTAGLFSDYDVPLGGGYTGRFSASANYISKQSNRGSGYLAVGDDVTTVRASFAVNAPAHWSATLFVDNLTNTNDAFPAVYSVPYWYPRPRPRTAGLQFEYHLR